MNVRNQTKAVALVVTILMAGAAFGQAAKVQGSIINTSDAEFKGELKWKPRDKAYDVIQENRTMEVALANVKEIRVAKPKELTTAEGQVRDGNAKAAIPALKKIAADYLMLTWDKPATRLLADALLKDNQTEEAIRVCDAVIRSDPDSAFLGEFAPIYWQALLKAGRNSKVEEFMTKAIKSGDRTASAFALIMRGDIVLSAGDTNENAKKALKDGYLRVVTLYTSEKAALPEAMYKAAKCFEKLGQTQRADSFRADLKKEFAGTEWAGKL